MSKLLVVFGATGRQGSSIIDFVLNDAELSKQFKIRGITRNASGFGAKALQKKGVEITQVDTNEKQSLTQAMNGAHTVYGFTMTDFKFPPEHEFEQGKAIGDAAVAAGVQYLIFSTVPSPKRITQGKLNKVTYLDAKQDVEEYIRTLPIKSSFLAPGSFMQNFLNSQRPRPVEDNTYVLFNPHKSTTQIPFIDIASDTGKFVGGILADPDKYDGKTLSAAGGIYSWGDVAKIMTKTSGKTVTHKEISAEEWSSVLPPAVADGYTEMYVYMQDYGYFGPGQKELVDWTAQQARGNLTTLEDFFAENPLNLV